MVVCQLVCLITNVKIVKKIVVQKQQSLGIEMFKADGRCYYCQMNYELDLKFE